MMITVLIATGTMNAGGAETLIMEILRHKTDRIRYVMLIHYDEVPAEGVYDKEIRDMDIPIVYIPSAGSVGAAKYIKLFGEKIRSIGHIDILHSHLNGVGGVIAKAAKKAGIEHRIIHCHADITFTGSRVRILRNELKLFIFKRLVARYGTAFWACSDPAGRRLFVNRKETTVIPNVIDIDKYQRNRKNRALIKEKWGFSDQLILGSVGRIAPIKNYEFMIDILSKLETRGIHAEYVCFGRIADETYYKALLENAEQKGVRKQIHFMGNSNDISNDIFLFDIFLMPSKSEGFGMAAIEAQAAGLPAIVSRGVPELIDVGLDLVQFLPLETDAWIDGIEKAQKICRPGNEAVSEAFEKHGFNAKTMVRKIEQKYIEMI